MRYRMGKMWLFSRPCFEAFVICLTEPQIHFFSAAVYNVKFHFHIPWSFSFDSPRSSYTTIRLCQVRNLLLSYVVQRTNDNDDKPYSACFVLVQMLQHFRKELINNSLPKACWENHQHVFLHTDKSSDALVWETWKESLQVILLKLSKIDLQYKRLSWTP